MHCVTLGAFVFLYRLVKALLGDSAVAKEKLEEGKQLVILGVEATVSREGLKCIPDKKKRKKWIARILRILEEGRLNAGEASKLSGALQWATQQQFRRLGRAMIRPIFRHASKTKSDLMHDMNMTRTRQIRRKSGEVDRELELALQWWLQVLELEIVEERLFKEDRASCVHMFSDARSKPPRVAAVLFMQAARLGF